MLVLSVVLFSKLVQSINNLQITNVLDMIGSRGRETIRDLLQPLDEAETPSDGAAKDCCQAASRAGPPLVSRHPQPRQALRFRAGLDSKTHSTRDGNASSLASLRSTS
jgi:hypothetical protein